MDSNLVVAFTLIVVLLVVSATTVTLMTFVEVLAEERGVSLKTVKSFLYVKKGMVLVLSICIILIVILALVIKGVWVSMID